MINFKFEEGKIEQLHNVIDEMSKNLR